MADYATLKAAIQAAVYENGNQEITGSVMQATLLAMINSLGANYQYAGIATPSTNPGTPDQNVFYLAGTAGTYVNFGDIVLGENEVAILKYNGTWVKDLAPFATAEKVNQIAELIGEPQTVIVRQDINPGTPTGSLYVRYNDGNTGSSGVNSVFWKMDISAYAGKTIHYSRVQIPAASGLQGIAFYNASQGYISGVQGVTGAAAWDIAVDTVIVPQNAKYASFTCPTAKLSSFELYIEKATQEYTDGLGQQVEQIKKNKPNLSIFVQRFNSSVDVIGGGYRCNTCRIGTRFNDQYDAVWQFGNKPSTINRYFDFRTIGIVARGADMISQDVAAATVLAGNHDTDYIAPVVVAAVNNKNGDFPDNTSYFTGGFHGYGNNTSGNYTPTMREISKVVKLDGIPMEQLESRYGDHLTIDVVNRLQGCNTEKQDGTGREILEQRIHFEMGTDGIPHIHIEYEALEAVTLYRIIGLSQYFDFPNVRFRGSSSKKGVYSKSANNTTSENKTFEIENFNDTYKLSIGMDLSKGIGDGRYSTFNAQVTSSIKGYFNLIQSSAPVSLDAGDIVEMFGYFKFK